MLKIYNVGPLFTEAEVKQRKYEGKQLRTVLEKNQVDYELFNPIDMPLNNQKDVKASDIYHADYERLNQADVVFFDLSNEDSGSCVALGIIMEKKLAGKKILVYPIFHDIRLSRNSLSGLESSCGFNSMVVGILSGNDIPVYSSFEDAFYQFCSDFQLDCLKLVEIQHADLLSAYQCFMSFEKDEHGFMNDAYGMSPESFALFVKKCELESQAIGLEEWKVPQTVYLLIDHQKAVGIFKLRHYLNDALKQGAGHIGYGIVNQYRGQGYATRGLKLVLEKCQEFGIHEVYLSVDKDNVASLKVQLACNAIIDHEDDQKYYTRIYLS